MYTISNNKLQAISEEEVLSFNELLARVREISDKLQVDIETNLAKEIFKINSTGENINGKYQRVEHSRRQD